MSGAGVPVERLVEHRDFVRRLARSLVRDEHDAADLEQEVWLTTLRSPPRHESGLRAWLGRVTRSRAVDRARGAVRREALLATSSERSAPSAAELAARLDAGRRVAAAVARLDEPYRAVLLLRFYDDLAPSEIAARTGVPLDTVRTRLRRAIERLRDDLDRDAGGRDRWVAAIAPIAAAGVRPETAGGTAGLLTGGAAMGAKTTIAAAAASAVLASLVTVQMTREEPAAAPVDAASAAEVRELTRRLDAVETRAKGAASARELASVRDEVERTRQVESNVAELQRTVAEMKQGADAAAKAAAARPQTDKPRDDAPRAKSAAAGDTVESLRRILADTSQTDAVRLDALTRLRSMPNGLTLEVLLAVRDFFRGTTDAATRETILRDLHNVKDEAALPEVRRLFIEGLRDPDEKVRDRAARDADTYASDPEVRLALEHARDSDESKGVRKKAAATLDAKPR